MASLAPGIVFITDGWRIRWNKKMAAIEAQVLTCAIG